MKVKYILHKINENMEGDKIIGIKEGVNTNNIMSKYDTFIVKNCGTIEIDGDTEFLQDSIIINQEYTREWEETEERDI